MQMQARVAIGCVTALVTALAPFPTHARLAEPPESPAQADPMQVEQSGPVAPDPTQPGPERPGSAQPDPEQPDPAQPDETGESPPLDIPVNVRDPTPIERARGLVLRRTGTGLMAGGGIIAAGGLGLTIAYTVIGDQRQALDTPVLADIEQAAKVAQIGGALLASGIAVIAIGGVIFSRGKRLGQPQPIARIRVTPAFGGLVVSGQF